MTLIDRLINLLAALTLIEMMVTIGLGVAVGEVLAVARNRRLLAQAAVANYVAVPAITVGLLLLFGPPPMVAVGFLIAAVCPGAPYGPPLTALARGPVVLSVGLMVLLAATSAVIAPLLLRVLIPLVAGDLPLHLDAMKLVGTLVLSQLLPLCVGLWLRQRRPALSVRLVGPLIAISKGLNLLLVGAILAIQFRMLMGIRPTAYVGMLALVGATFVAGWGMAGRDKDNRKSLAITTSVRNVGVSLVIVTGSFPGTAAIGASTAYGLVQTVAVALVALAWGRWAAGHWRGKGICRETITTRMP